MGREDVAPAAAAARRRGAALVIESVVRPEVLCVAVDDQLLVQARLVSSPGGNLDAALRGQLCAMDTLGAAVTAVDSLYRRDDGYLATARTTRGAGALLMATVTGAVPAENAVTITGVREELTVEPGAGLARPALVARRRGAAVLHRSELWESRRRANLRRLASATGPTDDAERYTVFEELVAAARGPT